MANYTQAQLDALRAALAQGVTNVSYGDKRVDYRSLDEMRQLISIMERDIAGNPRRRRFRVRTSEDKGL